MSERRPFLETTSRPTGEELQKSYNAVPHHVPVPQPQPADANQQGSNQGDASNPQNSEQK